MVRELAATLGGGRRRHPRRGGLRLDPLRLPDRPDRQDGQAQALPGGGHLRRDPAQGRHADQRHDRRHQHQPRSADHAVRRPRRRRRPVQDRARAERRTGAPQEQLRSASRERWWRRPGRGAATPRVFACYQREPNGTDRRPAAPADADRPDAGVHRLDSVRRAAVVQLCHAGPAAAAR